MFEAEIMFKMMRICIKTITIVMKSITTIQNRSRVILFKCRDRILFFGFRIRPRCLQHIERDLKLSTMWQTIMLLIVV